MRKEHGDRLFGRRSCESTVDVVAPELVAHRTYGAGRGCVGDASDFEIEGAKSEIGYLRGRRDECKQSVSGTVILPFGYVSIGT